MINKNLNYDFLSRLASSIAKLFGDNCETLIGRMDMTDHNIVEIYNGHVTGRKAGDKISRLGMNQIERQDFETDWIDYVTKTSDGKIMKSISIYVFIDDTPYVFGINFDCTDIAKAIPAIASLESLVSIPKEIEDDYNPDHKFNTSEEVDKEIRKLNKTPLLMKSHERRELVKNLYKTGFFNINDSVKVLANKLNISPYTVYKYLREIKQNKY
jgi:predicted transcriptional regulator YheO